jgi:hypothetical protein
VGRNLSFYPDAARLTGVDWSPAMLGIARERVAASASALQGVQWLYERITIPLTGEHFRRRPVAYLAELGMEIEESERFTLGIVERVCARKPG